MDDLDEALRHATDGRDWRTECYGYVNRLLEERHAARTARDCADLEALYRADAAPAVAHAHAASESPPFDHGADWAV